MIANSLLCKNLADSEAAGKAGKKGVNAAIRPALIPLSLGFNPLTLTQQLAGYKLFPPQMLRFYLRQNHFSQQRLNSCRH